MPVTERDDTRADVLFKAKTRREGGPHIVSVIRTALSCCLKESNARIVRHVCNT